MSNTTPNTTFLPVMQKLNDIQYGFPYKDRYGKITYMYNCSKPGNKSQSDIVKWCRRNFGERAIGWDFTTQGKNVIITIWDDKYKTMYELWHR